MKPLLLCLFLLGPVLSIHADDIKASAASTHILTLTPNTVKNIYRAALDDSHSDQGFVWSLIRRLNVAKSEMGPNIIRISVGKDTVQMSPLHPPSTDNATVHMYTIHGPHEVAELVPSIFPSGQGLQIE